MATSTDDVSTTSMVGSCNGCSAKTSVSSVTADAIAAIAEEEEEDVSVDVLILFLDVVPPRGLRRLDSGGGGGGSLEIT